MGGGGSGVAARTRLIGPQPGNPPPLHLSTNQSGAALSDTGTGGAVADLFYSQNHLICNKYDGLGVRVLGWGPKGSRFDPTPEPKYLDTFTAKSVSFRQNTDRQIKLDEYI